MALRLNIQRAFGRRGYNIWVLKDSADGYRVVKPMELEFGDPNGDGSFLLPEPTLFLREDEWHELGDSLKSELIASGFQPKADVLEGELKATKFHLEDMRTLVLKKKA